jgi:hypothetical protein
MPGVPGRPVLVALGSNAGSGVKALIARSAGAALAARPDPPGPAGRHGVRFKIAG